MKQFILDRHTVPGTTSLEQVPTDKIPVYETKTAAENDLVNLEVGQIVATKDEGNELSNPVDVVQDGNMHAVTSNAVADILSYSTNEVKTGGKWIDGKPIYRKTWIGTTVINGWNSITSLSALDISKVTKIEQVYEENDYIQGNYFASGTDRFRCIIRRSDMSLLIDADANRNYIVSLEYTKTTD